ncbi:MULTISPECIES: hypothetical protein [unclassified Burkholderia]|uniref:hypothetical protein n=1 Tax=unclassified Burkholderia TaxID=2613784 RepID=UPI000BF78D2A|nr:MULTISPECIES: hypothetical protein [unclassified Burkholderia]PFH12715.1 hypothetical protein BX604_7525 [Burkholderia sp. JKS000303]
MSEVTKPEKAATKLAARKVVVEVALRKKKPSPLTAETKAHLRLAARKKIVRSAPELPEWRKST